MVRARRDGFRESAPFITLEETSPARLQGPEERRCLECGDDYLTLLPADFFASKPQVDLCARCFARSRVKARSEASLQRVTKAKWAIEADPNPRGAVQGCEGCGHSHYFEAESDDGERCWPCNDCPTRICHGADGHGGPVCRKGRGIKDEFSGGRKA